MTAAPGQRLTDPEGLAPQPTADREPQSGSRWWRHPLVGAAIGWTVLIALWEVLARVVFGGMRLMAPPSGVVVNLIDNAHLYGRALLITGESALWGYLIGNVIAVALAFLVAIAGWTERLVLRLSLVVYCLPLVALGPLLRLIYGPGNGPQITLAAIAVFYMTLIPLIVGLRAVPSTWVELVASYGRGRWTALTVVRLRSSVPYLAAGMQIAVPAAFLGALVGEFTGAESGMGVLSILALRSLDTDGLWALATLSAIVTVAVYALVGAIGRRISPEQPPILMAAPADRAGRQAGWRWLRAGRSAALTVATILLAVAGWYAVLWTFDLNPYFAKSPTDVWAWLVTDPDAADNRGVILEALGGTAVIAIPGYLVGLLMGVLAAALFELSAALRRTMLPVAIALRCVPIIAIAPLLVQALGRGPAGIVVVVGLMTFFPTLVACMSGLRQTPGQVVELFDSYHTPRWRTLVLAQLPAMLPAFFAAARIGAPSAILAATVAEWLATGTGIGSLLSVSAATSRYDLLWSTVAVLTVVSVLAYWLAELTERLVLSAMAPEQTAR